MFSPLEKQLKKNLKLTYVKDLNKVIYSVEYQGKVYQESAPIEEFVQTCQKKINQEMIREEETFYMTFIRKIALQIESDN